MTELLEEMETAVAVRVPSGSQIELERTDSIVGAPDDKLAEYVVTLPNGTRLWALAQAVGPNISAEVYNNHLACSNAYGRIKYFSHTTFAEATDANVET